MDRLLNLGASNVFFYDSDGRQIGALWIIVSNVPQLPPKGRLENSMVEGVLVRVVMGGLANGAVRSDDIICSDARKWLTRPHFLSAHSSVGTAHYGI